MRAIDAVMVCIGLGVVFAMRAEAQAKVRKQMHARAEFRDLVERMGF